MKISLIKGALGLAATLNALLHDAFYEKIWGLNIAVYAAFFVILLLATTGKAQAKALIYLGG